MTRTLRPVFYRSIQPDAAHTLAALCRRAHVLGYELVPFNGYSQLDRPTADEQTARDANRDRLLDILGDDHYHAVAATFELWADLPTVDEQVRALGY